MAHDIFISYSTQNIEYAEAVCDKLENNGIECWIAPRNIKTATNYAKEIIDGLDSAKAIVLVFSKDAQESEYVNNEIDTAFSKNKPIVSIKVDDTFPKDQMEFFLKNTQWLDASPSELKQKNKTLDECYDQLVSDVKRVLKDPQGFRGGGIPTHGQIIPQKEKSFFERYKLPIIAMAVILIAIVGFVAYSGMNSQGNEQTNETQLSIGYIGLEDNGGGSYSYYVFGTVSDDLNDSSKDVIHIDYLDRNGKVVDSSDTSLKEMDGNILGSIDVTDKNVEKISLVLQDSNKKVLYSEESDNIIEQ